MGLFKKVFGNAIDGIKDRIEDIKDEMQDRIDNIKDEVQDRIGGFNNEGSGVKKSAPPMLSKPNNTNEEDGDDGPKIQLGELQNGVLIMREGIDELDDESLEDYKRLRKIVFPSSLKKLDSNVICYQEDLEEVDFSKVTMLTEIPDDFILGSHKICQFIIPQGVQSLGSDFLGEAKAGTEIYVPTSVKKLGCINSNCDNELIVYLFAANIDIEDVEPDIKTLYVMPQDYTQYAKKLKSCGSEARLREMPVEKMNFYGIETKDVPQTALQTAPTVEKEDSHTDIEKTPIVEKPMPETKPDPVAEKPIQEPVSEQKAEPAGGGLFSARLEAMIAAALQDGELTDKERELLKRRVEKEGEDWDEVEMIIEARLAEMRQNTPIVPPPLVHTVEKITIEENYADEATRPEKPQSFSQSKEIGSSSTQETHNDVPKGTDGNGLIVYKSGKSLVIEADCEEIADGLFSEEYDKEDIVKVVLPSGVIRIGEDAFNGCDNLKEVDFSKCTQLESIGESAFSSCQKIKRICLPAALKTIEKYAFDNCILLEEVDFSKCTQLESIGELAFSCGEKIKRICLPASINTIEDLAFYACFSLEEVDFSGNRKLKRLSNCFENCFNLRYLEIPDSVEDLDDFKFYSYSINANEHHLRKVVFPASLREIPKELCFKMESLEEVDLSKCSQLKRICESAFACTPNLKEVQLPDSVEVMEKWAFAESGNIKHINMPPSLKEMGYGTFVGSGIESVDFSRVNYLASIPEGAFGKCEKLKNVVLPASLIELGSQVFENSSIETVDFSKVTHLKTLPSGTFDNCQNLKNINLPDCIETIEDYMFYRCNRLATITMPASLSSIESVFFAGENTSLKNLDFSKVSLLEVIPENFIISDSLKRLTIPNGVTTIEDNAFPGVSNLEIMFLPPTLNHIGTFGYYDVDLYCFAPQIDELEPLVEDLKAGQQLRLHVLSQYLSEYVTQRDAEGISEDNLSIGVMPDEYLYYYDN